MAGRFINPYPQFEDATPEVYSGGKLYFYASGTSTLLNTYTTKALAVANPNPIVLNSAGRPAVDIFLQDLEYKVVLKDSSDNIIWTADPVSHRDSGLVVKTVTGSGSPNGTVAGTAGSASILPDFYWDYTNTILYVCTTTGTSSTAVWTAINASATTPAVPTPQGRLTPSSGTPVITADATSQTAVYYTPFNGNLVPIYNGASMTPTEFAELTLTLASQHVANTIYDVFVFSNSGVLTLVTGPAWTTSTAGSGARGTGASTTQLTRIKGLWVNAVSMTARNGSTTYTVGANLGTYVGSIIIDGSAGQVTCHVSYGTSRKYSVWNAYNRVPIYLKAGDSTATWAYQSATVRQTRATAANTAAVFTGLAEESFEATYKQLASMSVTGGAGTGSANIYVGFNSTTASAGVSGGLAYSVASSNATLQQLLEAKAISPPLLGLNNVNMLESSNATFQATFTGTEGSCLMAVTYRG